MGKKGILQYWQWVLAAFGLALVAWTVRHIGWAAIAQSLQTMGVMRLAALTLLYGLFQLCFCLAWRCTITEQTPGGFFKHLFAAYLAGDALNMTVPSANLAGEPVKVMLLKDKLAPAPLIASVTIYKMVDFFSMTLFLIGGLIVQSLYFTLPPIWIWGGWLVAGGMALGCLFLFLLQKNGFFAPLMAFLLRFNRTRPWAEKLRLLHESDESIRQFLSEHPGRFWAAVCFHFFAWAGGAVEIYIFLRWSGFSAFFPSALVIETFSLFLNNLAFFVPGRVGVLESGRVALFEATGFGAGPGLAYSLVRRLREIVWIASGFALLFCRKKGA